MMGVVLVVLALTAGLAIGYARHGRLRHLADPPPVRNRLLLTALGLHVLAVFASWAWEPALAVLSGLSWIVIAFYAWVNRWMPGTRLVALGLSANALVLILNGAVPVSVDALARAGASTSDTDAGFATQPTEHSDESTRAAALGKTIPVAFPPHPEVVSPGDVAVAAGLATVLATGMTGRRPAVVPAARRRSRYDDYLDGDDTPDTRGTRGTPGTPDTPDATGTPESPAAKAGSARQGDDHATIKDQPGSSANAHTATRHASA